MPVLADQIRKIHRETGFGILLLPLGQAAGHVEVALNWVQNLALDEQ